MGYGYELFPVEPHFDPVAEPMEREKPPSKDCRPMKPISTSSHDFPRSLFQPPISHGRFPLDFPFPFANPAVHHTGAPTPPCTSTTLRRSKRREDRKRPDGVSHPCNAQRWTVHTQPKQVPLGPAKTKPRLIWKFPHLCISWPNKSQPKPSTPPFVGGCARATKEH